MAKSNVELMQDLNALQGQVRQRQRDLSEAFDATGEDDSDSLLLDEADRALNAAVAAVDAARLKVATYEGLQALYAVGDA